MSNVNEKKYYFPNDKRYYGQVIPLEGVRYDVLSGPDIPAAEKFLSLKMDIIPEDVIVGMDFEDMEAFRLRTKHAKDFKDMDENYEEWFLSTIEGHEGELISDIETPLFCLNGLYDIPPKQLRELKKKILDGVEISSLEGEIFVYACVGTKIIKADHIALILEIHSYEGITNYCGIWYDEIDVYKKDEYGHYIMVTSEYENLIDNIFEKLEDITIEACRKNIDCEKKEILT